MNNILNLSRALAIKYGESVAYMPPIDYYQWAARVISKRERTHRRKAWQAAERKAAKAAGIIL